MSRINKELLKIVSLSYYYFIKRNMSSLVNLANKSYCLSTRSLYKRLEQSAVQERSKIFLEPESGQGPYTQNQKIIFKFPSTNFLDPTTLHLEMGISMTAAVNPSFTDYGFMNGCWDVIRRVRVLAGSTEIIDLDYYNTWVNFNYRTNVNWYTANTQGQLLEGFNPFPYTVANALSPSTTLPTSVGVRKREGTFTHQLHVGVFQVLQYIPLSLINDLTIELYLETNANALFTAGTATGLTYSLTNCRLYYDRVGFVPKFADAIVSTLSSGTNLFIPFYQVRCHEKSMAGNVDQFTFQIQEKVSSLNQVFVIPIMQIARNNENWNSTGMFSPGTIWRSHQFRLNQTYFPTYVIETTGQWWMNNFIATNQYGDPNSAGFINSAIAGPFMGQIHAANIGAGNNVRNLLASYPVTSEFYAYDFEREKCPDLTSGYNTNSGSTELEFIIKYNINNPLAVNITSAGGARLMLFFTLFDAVLSISGNGITSVFR
jgi:hypothetical protein